MHSEETHPVVNATANTTGDTPGGALTTGAVPSPTPSSLLDLAREAALLIETGHAPATLRGYKSAWTRFESWCRSRRLDPHDGRAETVALFLTERARTRAPATLEVDLAAIKWRLQRRNTALIDRKGLIKGLLRGARRRRADPSPPVHPIGYDLLQRMIPALPPTPRGLRDRAILSLGFHGALRRSEIVALEIADLNADRAGIALRLRGSKTSLAAETLTIPTLGDDDPTCPGRCLTDWRALHQAQDGPLFPQVTRAGIGRTAICDRTVARIVKRAVRLAGLPPETYSGHSLRAGFATETALRGVSDHAIISQTRHASVAGLKPYIRPEARNLAAVLRAAFTRPDLGAPE